MKTTIRHKNGKTWEIGDSAEELKALWEDEEYANANQDDLTYNGMTYKEYFNKVVLPVQMANGHDLEGDFEDED